MHLVITRRRHGHVESVDYFRDLLTFQFKFYSRIKQLSKSEGTVLIWVLIIGIIFW